MQRGAAIAILVAAVFVLSGCQYLLGLSGAVPPPGSIGGSFDPGAFGSLDPGIFGSFDPGAFQSFDPDESLPPPLATYSTGHATVTIAGTTTTLDHMSEPGALFEGFGAEATWTDGKGNYLTFYSDPEGSGTSNGFLQLDQIKDGQHLAVDDPSGCTVTAKQADTKGLSGIATCKGLGWSDTMSGFNGLTPSAPPVGAPFDATITFTATP